MKKLTAYQVWKQAVKEKLTKEQYKQLLIDNDIIEVKKSDILALNIADVGFSLPSKNDIQKRTEEYEKDNFRGKLIEGYAGKDFKAGIDYILDFISN